MLGSARFLSRDSGCAFAVQMTFLHQELPPHTSECPRGDAGNRVPYLHNRGVLLVLGPIASVVSLEVLRDTPLQKQNPSAGFQV